MVFNPNMPGFGGFNPVEARPQKIAKPQITPAGTQPPIQGVMGFGDPGNGDPSNPGYYPPDQQQPGGNGGGAQPPITPKGNPGDPAQQPQQPPGGGQQPPPSQPGQGPGLNPWQAQYDVAKKSLEAETNNKLSGAITDAQKRGVYYGTPLTTSQGDINSDFLRGLGGLQADTMKNYMDDQFRRQALAAQMIASGQDGTAAGYDPAGWEALSKYFASGK